MFSLEGRGWPRLGYGGIVGGYPLLGHTANFDKFYWVGCGWGSGLGGGLLKFNCPF